MRVTNPGLTRIGFAFETKAKRIEVSPQQWKLDPKESAYVAITRDALDPSRDSMKDDRVIVKWCRLPERGRAEYFMIGRKEMPIEYNV
uniref:MSP domain-containing protein n=1 Tax=Globodera pallida TaxID=36090 RepID=A0A183CIE5_GLOPA